MKHKKNKQIYVQQTLEWIQSFVIKLNLCPFAKREIEKNSLTIEVSEAVTIEQGLVDLINNIILLDTNALIETTIVLFPRFLDDFFDYLDFIDEAEAILFEKGYEGIYQLASFHPDYCFADVASDDVTNYTNRSPYPMIHILREDSLEKAIAYYGNTEDIPESNKKCLRKLGLEDVRKYYKLDSVVF